MDLHTHVAVVEISIHLKEGASGMSPNDLLPHPTTTDLELQGGLVSYPCG